MYEFKAATPKIMLSYLWPSVSFLSAALMKLWHDSLLCDDGVQSGLMWRWYVLEQQKNAKYNRLKKYRLRKKTLFLFCFTHCNILMCFFTLIVLACNSRASVSTNTRCFCSKTANVSQAWGFSHAQPTETQFKHVHRSCLGSVLQVTKSESYDHDHPLAAGRPSKTYIMKLIVFFKTKRENSTIWSRGCCWTLYGQAASIL